jgi:predicted enzyme related to lactoylglutathione lyase
MGNAVGWMRAIVVDCDDHERVAEFWRQVLDVEVAERMDGWVQLTPDPGGVYLAFQPRSVGNPDGVGADTEAPARRGMRLRPDLEVADIDAARDRIVELGGSLVRVVHEPTGDTHVVMADPEGNEFCILPPLPPELARPRWGDGAPG